jgi:aspartyl aminopeptidase
MRIEEYILNITEREDILEALSDLEKIGAAKVVHRQKLRESREKSYSEVAYHMDGVTIRVKHNSICANAKEYYAQVTIYGKHAARIHNWVEERRIFNI